MGMKLSESRDFLIHCCAPTFGLVVRSEQVLSVRSSIYSSVRPSLHLLFPLPSSLHASVYKMAWSYEVTG